MTVAAGQPELLIRDADPADHDAIRDLTVGVYVDEGYAGPHYVPTLADVAGRAASTELLVATVGRRVVGAVALATKGGPYAELAGPGEAVFRMLVVAPDQRGQGIAGALVGECLGRARAAGCRRMVISTEPEMQAAHGLYRRLGFSREPDRDWSPAAGVELLVYAMTL
ncbi:MAG: GNAT family N-acetyltransferase [Actinomycetota bacterium]|nr:GNAT family N-acetyltransferase [Actinomycetota bacterium]